MTIFDQRVWFFVLVMLKELVKSSSPKCDPSARAVSREGNNGQTSTFGWLGVLRVHLHHESTLQIALTGIALVKEGYAIANADDVGRIPKRIFKEDSKAMFIPRDATPWICRLRDYMTHPEYQYSTLNTIALLELEPGAGRQYPMRPVCWPPYTSNMNMSKLYAIGYTDENQLLEKSLYPLQYVSNELCKEFYTRAGLTEGMMAPIHYQCGYAQNNTDNCVWDNGMAMASNSSGYWILLGFGIRGPGCAAPARFIDLRPYYPWIESATNLQDTDEYPGFRKSAFNEGFQRQGPDLVDIPAHELLRSSDRPRGKQEFAHWWPWDPEYESVFDFVVNRLNDTALDIQKIENGTHGDCESRKSQLIYHDNIKVSELRKSFYAQDLSGTVVYKIAMYDLSFLNFTCVKLRVTAVEPEKAYLYYKTVLNVTSPFQGTPEDFVKTYIRPTLKPTPEPKTDAEKYKPNLDKMRLDFIEDKRPHYEVNNVNVLLIVKFQREATLDIRIFGLPHRPEPVFWMTTTSTTTKRTGTTTNPYYTPTKRRRNLVEDTVKARLVKNPSLVVEENVASECDVVRDDNIMLFVLSVVFIVVIQ